MMARPYHFKKILDLSSCKNQLTILKLDTDIS